MIKKKTFLPSIADILEHAPKEIEYVKPSLEFTDFDTQKRYSTEILAILKGEKKYVPEEEKKS